MKFQNCIEKSKIQCKLELMVKNKLITDILMPLEEIEQWKNQFKA